LQHLAVTGAILVPDHQVHRQPFQTPVGMRLNQLPHQFDIGKVADAQQHDRQVARDGITPKAGLPASITHQDAAFGAHCEAFAKITEFAKRPYSCASASEALIWRSTTCAWVQASSNTRSARR
jgi:hypothetical protein